MLLYRGHDDMADYLRNSPFNRCVYNVILRHGPNGITCHALDAQGGWCPRRTTNDS